MGLLSTIAGFFGCGRSSSPAPKDNRISATAEFNHKIGPIDRGERYEDPLEEALSAHGYGETDGGGTMLSKEREVVYIDVHMFLSSPDTSIPFVTKFLEDRGAPKGSKLKIFQDDNGIREIPFGRREGFAIYLDGINLPAEIYAQCDINVVVGEIDKRLKGHGEIEAHWQGPTETALYVYGDANAVMKPLIDDFIASHPLCKGARIVDLTPSNL
jgi:hypothetical protein